MYDDDVLEALLVLLTEHQRLERLLNAQKSRGIAFECLLRQQKAVEKALFSRTMRGKIRRQLRDAADKAAVEKMHAAAAKKLREAEAEKRWEAEERMKQTWRELGAVAAKFP
jgi:hypothetical protein